MNKQRGLGFALVLIGIVFISSSTFGITGAVIGVGVVEFAGTLIGLAFIMAGCVVLMAGAIPRENKLEILAKRTNMNLPDHLSDLVESYRVPTDNLVIAPDTQFIVDALKKPGHRNALIDMSGYSLVILNKVLKECKGKVPMNITNYLKSNHVNSEVLDGPRITPEYEDLIKYSWIRYCAADSKRASRRNEYKNILYGADSNLLVLGIERGENPTLILSDDTHLREIAPIINEEVGTNIYVRGINDYFYPDRYN